MTNASVLPPRVVPHTIVWIQLSHSLSLPETIPVPKTRSHDRPNPLLHYTTTLTQKQQDPLSSARLFPLPLLTNQTPKATGIRHCTKHNTYKKNSWARVPSASYKLDSN